ncbi:uncharacterized protein Z520_05844 [Fonsecaea multimorphosa CBS 102226]|uniref:Uncharacterized protein n=1 Tax=Fonsecaea multimorphosa CBS 102226 TaxID=1442371 RepID=A0A0D2KPB6_9EURO|nr:uncharacterized protein Z520_05844 [Fonsecaea multimorphosa CBS 102226]KIX98543.1 hypothetical protein Z520_05844 [Fonsecaea multimorphosa CBS 102226]OAL24735.1 hypothetical protein AYO22_05524 [Fonsecaea multimorphosa]
MDELAHEHKARYDDAMEWARAGVKHKALEICWQLRLDRRLSKYRRVLLNFLLACLVEPEERLKFAEESLDIIDIIRQDLGGRIPDYLQKVETLAEEYVEQLEEQAEEARMSAESNKMLLSALPADIPALSSPQEPGDKDGARLPTFDEHVAALFAAKKKRKATWKAELPILQRTTEEPSEPPAPPSTAPPSTAPPSTAPPSTAPPSTPTPAAVCGSP